jgi:hypothetical protein
MNMKICVNALPVMLLLAVCSCTADGPAARPSREDVPPANSRDQARFIVLCEVLGPQADSFVAFLRSNGVAAHNVGGSEFHSITVPESHLTQAKQLLGHDDVKKKYEFIMPKE